jgi:hypothetical protein
MAANKLTEINDYHKERIKSEYQNNPKFKRSDLAKELGLKPMRVINFIFKEKQRNKPKLFNGKCCPITGF